ncbi:Oxidoreductase molybdopterin binding domain-containing protein [Halorubrum aquaticum]|uniref:Oxidoreductase molybdopterin binding domain-containing protein n=1 Tax=Halorubrum aquaticum TaxID=387340 RepID=A0A1I3BTH0_9EURY|nr:molybdopterin-dependent oxidoreductase [Halorubrum aquaticum]SFH65523.1 Oxidoreductase molybdopterin binding domain-containing protein [Halorubrum aquaticum]
MGVRATLSEALDRLEPPARVVDWSLLAVVLAETVTGLVSFTVGTPEGWPLFWLHRSLGLAIVVLLGWKLSRVGHRLLDRKLWQRSTALSVLTLVAAVGTVSTGMLWVIGLDVRLSYWTLLSIHVGFGLALLPLVAVHASTRFRPPRRVDFEGRRTAVQYGLLLIAGAVAYRVQQGVNGLLSTPGADRRFTGSQPREGEGNGAFPVTSWVADDPDPIDRERYRLSVTGLVAESREFAVDDVERVGGDEASVLLDCTSGWYTVQEWSGVRVGDLIEAAGGVEGEGGMEGEGGAEGDDGVEGDGEDEPAYVRFVSVTGYRWSLPIAEAEDALLATHVGGDRLAHGHGGPARLVAPGRRGFQWVKWVTRVEVRSERDPAQWVVTLVSGFDSAGNHSGSSG